MKNYNIGRAVLDAIIGKYVERVVNQTTVDLLVDEMDQYEASLDKAIADNRETCSAIAKVTAANVAGKMLQPVVDQMAKLRSALCEACETEES